MARNLRRIYRDERSALVWADYAFRVHGVALGIVYRNDWRGEAWIVG